MNKNGHLNLSTISHTFRVTSALLCICTTDNCIRTNYMNAALLKKNFWNRKFCVTNISLVG